MMKRLLIPGLVWTVLLLAAAEGVVRVFFAQNMSGRFSYGYDEAAGFEEEGERVRLVRAGGRRFFPQEYAKQAEPGVLRVMVIGDSVPRGPDLEKSYARQLEKMLRESGRAAEVWNLAVGGYGARRSRLVLEQALHYGPDVVVWHLNRSNEFEDEREWRRAEDFRSWHPRNWMMKVRIFARLYELRMEKLQWELLPQAVRVGAGVMDVDAEVAAESRGEVKEQWRTRAEAVIREGVGRAVGAGARVVLVVQNRRVEGEGGRMELRGDAELERLAAELKSDRVAVLSLQELFSALPDPGAEYSDSAHLRGAGHRRVAAALLPLVAGNGVP